MNKHEILYGHNFIQRENAVFNSCKECGETEYTLHDDEILMLILKEIKEIKSNQEDK